MIPRAPWWLGGLLAGCGNPPGPASTAVPPADLRPHVILVTLDTTRADHLGAYGRAEARTPVFDALAAAGQRFDRAFSPVPLTIPSHATLLTGLDPHHHGIRDNGSAVLDGRFLTLAEQLSAQGWDTAASVSAFVTQRRWGLCQGYDACFDTLPAASGVDHAAWALERPAAAVVDDALGWWDGRTGDRPAHLWVHFYDAHRPYEPPEPFRSELEGLPYDAEIAAVDAQLGRLRDHVSQDGREILWVIAGDHGEGQGGHGEREHGWYTYNATQRVPLVLAGPGVAPSVVSQAVGLVDVLPTVLALLGLEPPAGLDGRPQPGQPHPIYLESWTLLELYGYAPHQAVVDGPWKLIDTPRPELYDHVADVREQRDLSAEHPDQVARLQAVLAGLGVTPPAAASALDADTLARLQALGYVGGSSGGEAGDAPDPKDRQGVLRRIVRSQEALDRGDRDGAVSLLREALDQEPGATELRTRLARMLAKGGRLDEALVELEVLVGADEVAEPAWASAASVMGSGGDHAAAAALSSRGLARHPDSRVLRELSLIALLNLERHAEAARLGQGWVAAPDQDPGLAGLIGLAMLRDGSTDAALPWLVGGLSADLVTRDVRFALAGFAPTPAEAEPLLLAELQDFPDNWDARLALLRLTNQAGRHEDALAHAEVLVSLDPADPAALHARAMSLFNLKRYTDCLAAVERALGQHPEDPDLVMLLANAQSRLGDRATALETRDRAEALHQRALEGGSGAP